MHGLLHVEITRSRSAWGHTIFDPPPPHTHTHTHACTHTHTDMSTYVILIGDEGKPKWLEVIPLQHNCCPVFQRVHSHEIGRQVRVPRNDLHP